MNTIKVRLTYDVFNEETEQDEVRTSIVTVGDGFGRAVGEAQTKVRAYELACCCHVGEIHEIEIMCNGEWYQWEDPLDATVDTQRDQSVTIHTGKPRHTGL